MSDIGLKIADIAETLVKKSVQIPGEFLGTAKKQVLGDPAAKQQQDQEKNQAQIAKRKLPGLTANDQRQASQRISQIRQQLVQSAQQKRQAVGAGPAIPEKPKLPPIAVRNMYNQASQTGERKLSVGG